MLSYLLMLHLFQTNYALIVLATLVLKPDSYDAGGETCHLNQLFLQEGIGSAVGCIARAEGGQWHRGYGWCGVGYHGSHSYYVLWFLT